MEDSRGRNAGCLVRGEPLQLTVQRQYTYSTADSTADSTHTVQLTVHIQYTYSTSTRSQYNELFCVLYLASSTVLYCTVCVLVLY